MPRQLAFGEGVERIERNIEHIISRLEKLECQVDPPTQRDEVEPPASISAGEVKPQAATSSGEVQRSITRQPFRQGSTVSLQPKYTIYSVGPSRSAGNLFAHENKSSSQPIVPDFGKKSASTSKIQIKRVRFTDEAMSSSQEVLFEDDNIVPVWLFKEPQMEELIADQDQPVVNLFVNNMKTIPDYSKYPKLKVAVSSFQSNRLKDKPFKLLADKEMTGAELHSLVKKAHGIPEDENLTLVYPQYRVIEPDSMNLWQHGIRYFPAYITQVPEDFKQGDLMEVRFTKKGPNVNGPGKTWPHSQ